MPRTAAPTAPRSPVLLQLEALATWEIGAALALAGAARQPADVLAACIQWDLDSAAS